MRIFSFSLLILLLYPLNIQAQSFHYSFEQKDTGNDIPRFAGSFIQEYLVADWTDGRWEQEMQMLKEAGMKYLIYAPSLLADGKGKITSTYPSSLTKKKCQNKTLEACLRSAQKNGLRIFVGLNFNERWWKVDYDAAWLKTQMAIGNRVAGELVRLYKEKYPDAMYGWYWVWEVDNLNCMSDERQRALADALNINLDYLSELTPDMPLMLSPFMNHKVGGNAEQYGKMWENVFSQVHFRAGDIFAPQDCIGAGGLNLDNLWEWFSRLKQAVNTKLGLRFWGNIETFDQRFWITAPLERVRKQLEIVNGCVENLICFAYSHYNSPFVVNRDYHRIYLQYCYTGQFPVVPIPNQVLTVNTNKTSKGMKIHWVSGDLTAVDGYSIYRDGTLIKKIQIISEKLPSKYIDKEGGLDCTYEIATFNVIGQESVKTKAE